jgi:hypothetical protein
LRLIREIHQVLLSNAAPACNSSPSGWRVIPEQSGRGCCAGNIPDCAAPWSC